MGRESSNQCDRALNPRLDPHVPSTAFALLTVLLFAASGAARAQTSSDAKAPSQLIFIVRCMEKAQAAIQLPRHVTREYRLGAPDHEPDSDVVAEIDLTPPGTYTLRKNSGSDRGERVVKRILDHEIATALSPQEARATAVTRENYDFSYLGKTDLNGHSYYLLQMLPRRQQPELIAGRAWIDPHTFLIRRLEGELAKSPSWWVKRVHVDLGFSSFQATWVQTTMEAVAEVRCFGAQKLTSLVLNYAAGPLTAKNQIH